ncbi:MAG TPA: hypothetical protein VN285_12910 [Candidatus Deferrimicrobium sp.]|nr:hypothetical protein [Candidatus Deferrimicrobium sp.]
MKCKLSFLSALLLLSVGPVLASQVTASHVTASLVTDVALHYQDGSAVARIAVEGPVRFTHQTEDAKDGKPFRVIVDVLSAVHQLPAKSFLSLPQCPVWGIRTSQYATTPEKVVRLVFDMQEPTVYRVDSDEHSITLFFPDKQRRTFATWSSSDSRPDAGTTSASTAGVTPVPQKPEVAAGTAQAGKTDVVSGTPGAKGQVASSTAQPTPKVATAPLPPKSTGSPVSTQPAPSEKPVVASTPVAPAASQATEAPVKTLPPAKHDEKQALPSQTTPSTGASTIASASDTESKAASKSPIGDVAAGKPTAGVQPQVPSSVVVSAPKPPASEELKAKQELQSESAPKPAGQTPKQPSSNVGSPSVTMKATLPQPTAAQDSLTVKDKIKPIEIPESTWPPRDSPAVTPTDNSSPGSTDSAGPGEDEERGDSKLPTSRFRRSPTNPTKIKGTLVAEFPQRLVIKYVSPTGRDPFETLINQTKMYNDPIERQVPNVEVLKLVGVLEAEAGPNRALFEDKDGYGYILEDGDQVQNGYVLRIESDRVYFQLFEYGWSRTVALNIEED